MEEYAIDLIVGKGPAARTLRLDLPRFTLIGATTRLALLSSPLRDRFGLTYHLDYYSEADISSILERSAKLLKVPLEPDARTLLAGRSRRTPRVANRLLKRVRDFATVRTGGTVDVPSTTAALEQLGIDQLGLDPVDRRTLVTIIDQFNGGGGRPLHPGGNHRRGRAHLGRRRGAVPAASWPARAHPARPRGNAGGLPAPAARSTRRPAAATGVVSVG